MEYQFAYFEEKTNHSTDVTGNEHSHEHHLSGAYGFASTGPIDLNIRGLSQAGTWNYIREEITVALQHRRTVRFSPEFKFIPDVIMPDDVWANAISFTLARIINFAFNVPASDQVVIRLLEKRMAAWDNLAVEVALWRQRLPDSCKPFSTAVKTGNPFPSIWFLRPWYGWYF